MSSAPRSASIERSVSLGFAALLLCLGCASSSRSGGAGGAMAEGGGAPAEDGGENNGGENNGGENNGGENNGGENNGNGGSTSGCEVGECFVANTCLNQCGGAIVYVGCCECVAPAVNRNVCAPGY